MRFWAGFVDLIIIIIIIDSSRGSFAQPSYGIQHSTGVTYSLAGTLVGTRVCGRSAPYAVEGRNFHGPQRDAAWLFLTVFIALTGFPHGVFPLWPDVRDSPTAPRLIRIAQAQYYHGELPTRLDWTLQYIFVYTAGPSTLQESSPSDSKLSLFTQDGARRNSRISLNSEMK